MLRSDVPQVRSNVIRWEAFVNHVACWIALAGYPWVLLLRVVQGLLRGFAGHHRDLLHGVWKRLFEARGWAGRRENAGAKMFANKILFFASTVAVVLYASGSTLWILPCIALIAFSFMEWAFSFCAACWVYSAWYPRFPPKAG
jgi:hypothetical protein